MEDWVAGLRQEWDPDHGFIGKLRFGDFDETALARLLALLNTIDVEADDCLPRSFVSMLWQMPHVMEWQVPHQVRNSGDVEQLQRAIAAVRNEVERILGVA